MARKDGESPLDYKAVPGKEGGGPGSGKKRVRRMIVLACYAAVFLYVVHRLSKAIEHVKVTFGL